MGADAAAEGATAQLAHFVRHARFSELPESARHAARRAFVNIVGCCLSGATHEIVDIAARTLLTFGGAPHASLLGRVERTDVLTATLLNCVSSGAFSFDDTHADAILHPSGAVATALLALAEQRSMPGEDFLLAFVLGIDVASRVSKAVSTPPASGDIGWSQTGIAAGIGAAAAAAKVLHLEAERITWAIAMAAVHASGLRVSHGTMSSTLIFGHAAHVGLRAALLAKGGLNAPVAALEGKYGFTSLYARRAHLPYLTSSLGARFEVESLAYKPYPCGIVIHPSVDAAIDWHRTQGPDSAAIRTVTVRTHPSALALGFRRHPMGVFEAKVSLCHWIAAALARGRAGIAEGDHAAIADPAIVRLREIVEVQSDSTLGPDAAVMTVTSNNGQQHTIAIEHCIGSVDNPMSDADLDAKFHGQAQLSIARECAQPLLERCWKVDQLNDVAEIVRLARQDR